MAPSKNINSEIGNERLERSIDMLMGSFSVPVKSDKEEIWNSISNSISQKKEVAIVPLWKRSLRVAAVAIPFALLIFSATLYFTGQNEYYAQAGNQLSVILPDSSRVLLNAETKVSFNSVTWKYNRKVKMTGEALFTVKKGETFSVVSGESTTQVLGTVFNIYFRGSEVRVVCLEGKVKVKNNITQQSVILNPGLKTVAKAKQLTAPVAENREAISSWTNGEFYYTNEPLKNVIDEISRQYNVKIKTIDLKGRNYSGYFNKNSISKALDLVCLPMNLSWVEINGVIQVTEKKE